MTSVEKFILLILFVFGIISATAHIINDTLSGRSKLKTDVKNIREKRDLVTAFSAIMKKTVKWTLRLLRISKARSVLLADTIHYANTPMQYTAIFHGCKNVDYQMKNYNIFLIFAQTLIVGTH